MSKNKLIDKIIVIDLEATCWEVDGDYQKEHSEIIEVGVCELSVTTGEITKSIGILVKPEHSEISPFCTQLTSITPKMIEEEGVSLTEACNILMKEYQSEYYQFAGYGAYDQRFFREQCKKKNIFYPMHHSYTNVKVALSKKLGIRRGLGMDKALQKLNIPLEGTHHRGVDDAKNIAKILRWTLNN
ncbi:exonuclease domain-containing protein [Polaribacter batillariae]|uniref:Exonuclease domain-containing protein n=1 Tax=Polaribacter batillariae TaxID=2808900 RepID=A0ABX7SY53_9FLAO|nr:3'-5' exonuclease [Polaribacter batillariae]QTD39020.1 exonuclease domain-containing protein [Polaribacter batillariae]QTD39190.1 exonuclease domain-containing protein [Polaribacter batillariae]